MRMKEALIPITVLVPVVALALFFGAGTRRAYANNAVAVPTTEATGTTKLALNYSGMTFLRTHTSLNI